MAAPFASIPWVRMATYGTIFINTLHSMAARLTQLDLYMATVAVTMAMATTMMLMMMMLMIMTTTTMTTRTTVTMTMTMMTMTMTATCVFSLQSYNG